MRNTALKVAVVMAAAAMTAGSGFGLTFVTGGGVEIPTVSYEDDVWVDWGQAGVGTTLILESGIAVGSTVTSRDLCGFQDSIIILDGGVVTKDLNAYHSSQVTLNSGSISGQLTARDNAVVHLYGGVIGGNILLEDNAELFIYGVGFMLDSEVYAPGQYIPLPLGFSTLNVMFVEGGEATAYVVNCQSADAGVFLLIPEPATLCLLTLGGLVLRKRRL